MAMTDVTPSTRDDPEERFAGEAIAEAFITADPTPDPTEDADDIEADAADDDELGGEG